MAGGPPLPKKALSACQALELLWAILRHALAAAWGGLRALARLALRCPAEEHEGVEFWEGTVAHERRHEGSHAFAYAVRMAVVDLGAPPPWWRDEPVARLSAEEARAAAGTDGRVRLLTTPSCAGYDQNPIQVYYCEDSKGGCARGICEVTNTPWNHRVYFAFDLAGAELPKPLHVSPLMDLTHRWRLRSTPPSASALEVLVDVLAAPEMAGCPAGAGSSEAEAPPLFRAHLKLQRSPRLRARAEHSGSLGTLWRYGFQPQRTAVRIYLNAVRLLRMGIAFRPQPPPQYKRGVLERMQAPGGCLAADLPWWADNQAFPWGPSWAGHKAD